MPAPFRSDRVAVVRQSPILLALSFALAVVSLVSLVALSLRSPLGALVFPAAPLSLAALLAAREQRWPKIKRTRLEADETGLREHGKLLVARDDIRGGFALPMGDGCLVRLTRALGRRPIDIAVEDENTGRALLRALGLDASQTTADLPGLSTLRHLSMHLLIGAALLMMFVVTAIVPFVAHGSPRRLTLLGFALLALMPFVATRITSKLRVGVDGIFTSWLLSRRFIPFSRVKALNVVTDNGLHGVELELDSGRRHRIWISEGADFDVARLAFERVSQAYEAYRLRRAATDTSEALARKDRSPSEWLSALRGLGAGALADMRTATVPHERLWDIVDDPSAPAAARLGAAIALTSAGTDEDRSRVRIAAHKVAEPKLRVGFEKSADSAATDDELAEALAELEQAGRR